MLFNVTLVISELQYSSPGSPATLCQSITTPINGANGRLNIRHIASKDRLLDAENIKWNNTPD